jgi:hypothetical protein
MYQKPYSKKEILEKYPKDFAEKLLSDPIHLWRAETGIELIHKEPTKEELDRIWKNWNEMPEDLKKKSDEKSFELFGKTNKEHYDIIMSNY